MRLLARLFSILILLFLGSTASAMEQRIGDFEIAIDAPWRMEPRNRNLQHCAEASDCGSGYEFGAIPINVAILDGFLPNRAVKGSYLLQRALQRMERGVDESGFVTALKVANQVLNPFADDLFGEYPNMTLDRFVVLTVFERIDGRFVRRAAYRINDMHEVERTVGAWEWAAPGEEIRPRPLRQLCRRWSGMDCRQLSGLRETSEWHSIAMYTPTNKTPGSNVYLKLDVTLEASTGRETFSQFVKVHLGEEPLPKFGKDWYYGDIHYHSQGTDNDGESGYSYRSALQAMSALGLDFAFATDHASDSKQLISLPLTAFAEALALPAPSLSTKHVLRDLNHDRFSYYIEVLNGPNGANREVASYTRKNFEQIQLVRQFGQQQIGRDFATPQLFLGSEIDIIPEFEIGKNAEFWFRDSCTDLGLLIRRLHNNGVLGALVSSVGSLIDISHPDPDVCGSDDLVDHRPDGRALIRDIQGPHNGELVSKNFFGRQHMLHLPEDPQRRDAFISSRTSIYGGATRRMKDVLRSEFAGPNGVLFLAHPVSTPSGSGEDRIGPDIAPYAEAPLLDAFNSKHVLGLQLWNENNHFKTEMGDGDAVSTRPDSSAGIEGEMVPVANLKEWRHKKSIRSSSILEGIRMWDSMLMWGLDPSMTREIEWLADDEPRRVFMAGGSDAHGDYNYRRDGYVVGVRAIGDGAIGSPRNLVFGGPPKGTPIIVGDGSGTPVSQGQIVGAFRDGNFVVTDGPIIRMAYDKNNNDRIDGQDTPMGSIIDVGGLVTSSRRVLPLLVEWKSTPEFGQVAEIDLYIGVFSNEYSEGWFYHPRRNQGDLEVNTLSWKNEGTGKTLYPARLRTPLGDRGVFRARMVDPTDDSVMSTDIPAYQGYAGSRVIRIDPADFPVALLRQERVDTERECGSLTSGSGSVAALRGSARANAPSGEGRTAPIGTPTTNMPERPTLEGDGDLIVVDPPDRPDIGGCIIGHYEDPRIADKMFVRAELRGRKSDGVIRKAFTNPIWFNMNYNNFFLDQENAVEETQELIEN